MRVNPKKTQLLCISATNHTCNAYIKDGGDTIIGGDTLKILGFTFNRSPTVEAQVHQMITKFRTRLWTLRYLRTSGMGVDDLLAAYLVFLRPLLEYAAPALHLQLTKEQTGQLELQQSRALKIVFGFGNSYRSALEKSGLTTLEERRRDLTDRFAEKLQASPRFGYLFPERKDFQRRARMGKRFREDHAKTSRLFNSPIFYMRRRLNDLDRETRTEAAVGSASTTAPTTSQRCDFVFDEWRWRLGSEQ